MQIEDTRWYTAVFLKAHELSETGTTKIERINGYRMKLAGWSEEEIREHVNLLIAEGVKGKVRTSKQNHTDIPAGEPSTKECPHCFSTIDIRAKKCPNCTADI